jgi:hypothetical protein
MKGCAVLVQLLDRKNETPVHGRAGQGRINADPRPTSFSCYRPSGAYSEGSEPSPTTGAAPADALGRSQLPANVPPRSELSSQEAAEQFLRLRPRPRLNFLPLRRPPPAGSEWLDLKAWCRLVLFLQERPLPPAASRVGWPSRRTQDAWSHWHDSAFKSPATPKPGTASNSGLDEALYLNYAPSGEEMWDNASLNEELGISST